MTPRKMLGFTWFKYVENMFKYHFYPFLGDLGNRKLRVHGQRMGQVKLQR
jgi:hypothetical protein